jgi:hypothetical protein
MDTLTSTTTLTPADGAVALIRSIDLGVAQDPRALSDTVRAAIAAGAAGDGAPGDAGVGGDGSRLRRGRPVPG